MLRRSIWIFFLIGTGLSTTVRTLAQTVEVAGLLEEAEEAFLDVEYENALDLLLRAESLGGLGDSDMMRLLALRGTLMFLQGEQEEARVAYGRLLSFDPDFRLPEEHPPRAAEFLETVRQETARPVSLAHSPPGVFEPGEPMLVEASILDLASSHAVRVFFRLRGEGGYSSTEMVRRSGDLFVGTIPATGALGIGAGGVVEYFIMVVAGDDRIANSGTPNRPHSFRIRGSAPSSTPTRERTSVVRSWWFWTAIGGAVVLAFGLGLGLGLGDDAGPAGSVDVTLRFTEDQ